MENAERPLVPLPSPHERFGRTGIFISSLLSRYSSSSAADFESEPGNVERPSRWHPRFLSAPPARLLSSAFWHIAGTAYCFAPAPHARLGIAMTGSNAFCIPSPDRRTHPPPRSTLRPIPELFL